MARLSAAVAASVAYGLTLAATRGKLSLFYNFRNYPTANRSAKFTNRKA
jgi:hypothetical protein